MGNEQANIFRFLSVLLRDEISRELITAMKQKAFIQALEESAAGKILSDYLTGAEEDKTFKELAHDLAMQVAAVPPQFITQDEASGESDIDLQTACLLLQPYIKDPTKTVQDLILETIAKVGENIKVSRFARFELGK